MSSLAAKTSAINLGQGFPDYEMDEELIRLVNHFMLAGKNQYVHMNGLLQLREAIANKIHLLYRSVISVEDNITVTPGGTYAIYTALTSVLQPDDEVVVFEPAYDSYIPNIITNGAIPVIIHLSFPDFNIDWQLVKNKINDRTRVIIINSPHNPTGNVLKENDIEELKNIVANSNILIVSDEVYEHVIFDGIEHQSILKHPELLERSLVCFSFGKTFNCTGWKIGYCVSGNYLMKEFRKVHQFNCFSCNSPVQFAIAEFLEADKSYLTLGKFLEKKKDFLSNRLTELGFQPIPSHGSYFQLFQYNNISHLPDKDFAIELVNNAGVATIPLSAFFQQGTDYKILRFCFCKKDETLNNAVEKLRQFIPR
jgi:methionine aminotransferase